MYSYRFVWPLIELVTDAFADDSNVEFFPGEIYLSSFSDYKADAVVKYNEFEVLLLEVSGAFGSVDASRDGYDHIKGAFGALCMLKNVARSLHWGSMESLLAIKVLFAHARAKSLHLWTIEFANEVLVFERIARVSVPDGIKKTKDTIDLGNFVWRVKSEMMKIISALEALKKEHEEHETELLLGGGDGRPSLKKMAEISLGKPVRGAGYGILLPEDEDKDNINVKVTV